MRILPEQFLRCLSPEDRKSLGRGGITAEEALAKQAAKSERDLQKQIASLLSLKGIQFFSQRMDKRTRGKVGQPDFLFCIGEWTGEPGKWYIKSHAVAWEIKYGDGELSKTQKQTKLSLQILPNCWRWAEIRSVDQALEELRAMGI